MHSYSCLLFREVIDGERVALIRRLVPAPELDHEVGARPPELHQSNCVNLLTSRVRGRGSAD